MGVDVDVDVGVGVGVGVSVGHSIQPCRSQHTAHDTSNIRANMHDTHQDMM